MLPVLIWVGLSICAGYYGRFRRLGFAGWFILSMLLSPFLTLVVLFITAPKRQPLMVADRSQESVVRVPR